MGFTVADSTAAKLEVKMVDTWRWNWGMFLNELDLVFREAQTGILKAHSHYRIGPGLPPSPSDVVTKMFKALDDKGVFQHAKAP